VYSSPVGFNGISQKTLINTALTEGKIVHGLERDDDGQLFIVVAFPLSMRGKVIGATVYEKNLAKAIEEFKAHNHSDIRIVNLSNQLDYSTNELFFDEISSQISQVHANSASIIKLESNYFSVVNLPINDNNGNHIATLYSSKDFTESYNHQRSTIISSVLVSVLTAVLAMLGIYYYMNIVLKAAWPGSQGS